MAFDEKLAQRVRRALGGVADVTENRQFGCLGFHVRGNMACVIDGERLIVRVGAARYEAALARQNVAPMDFAGRPARGMVYVLPAGLRRQAQVDSWVSMGVAFAQTLKEKTTRKVSTAARRTPAARRQPA